MGMKEILLILLLYNYLKSYRKINNNFYDAKKEKHIICGPHPPRQIQNCYNLISDNKNIRLVKLLC